MFTFAAAKLVLGRFYNNNKMEVWTFSFLFLLLLLFIIPNFNAISEKFGFETKASLREKVVQEKANTDKVIEAAKASEKTVGFLQIAQEETIKAVEIKQNNETRNAAKINKIKVTKQTKITTLKQTIIKKQDPPTDKAEIEISKTQMTAIWDSYNHSNFSEQPQPIQISDIDRSYQGDPHVYV